MKNIMNLRGLFSIMAGLILLALFAPYMVAIQGGENRTGIVIASAIWSIIVIESIDLYYGG